jgi:hypothetical protein
MTLRIALVSLIITATVTFVVGVAIERSDEADHHDTGAEVAREPVEKPPSETAEEPGTEHAKGERHVESGEEAHTEFRPLGIDVEAWPFVTIAALVSLALAAAGWLRPAAMRVVALIALAMFAFAALDVREVLHQLDVDETGLAVLAGAVAGLHAAAGLVAAAMASRARRGSPGAAGTMAP